MGESRSPQVRLAVSLDQYLNFGPEMPSSLLISYAEKLLGNGRFMLHSAWGCGAVAIEHLTRDCTSVVLGTKFIKPDLRLSPPTIHIRITFMLSSEKYHARCAGSLYFLGYTTFK
jgi:hypothetical protein